VGLSAGVRLKCECGQIIYRPSSYLLMTLGKTFGERSTKRVSSKQCGGIQRKAQERARRTSKLKLQRVFKSGSWRT
jgi:hypothetical protein